MEKIAVHRTNDNNEGPQSSIIKVTMRIQKFVGRIHNQSYVLPLLSNVA